MDIPDILIDEADDYEDEGATTETEETMGTAATTVEAVSSSSPPLPVAEVGSAPGPLTREDSEKRIVELIKGNGIASKRD